MTNTALVSSDVNIFLRLVNSTVYVTVPGKTDHFVIISDFEILVPR